MKLIKLVLFPIAFLYGLVMRFRNILYDINFLKSRKFDLPVISVGNLTVGGTGKTPHVEYLLNLLKIYKKATLSRGYKRKTTGFVLAGQSDSAATIGDEPYQYYLDFPETIVAVCEKRVNGIENILRHKPEIEVIILDDAFQHRPVTPTLNLLITDFYRRFDEDFMIPTGLLREPRSGAGRADAVVVSKCPDELHQFDEVQITKNINTYVKPGTPIFFTKYNYGRPVAFGKNEEVSNKIILVTGIANAVPLVSYLKGAGYVIVKHFNFPDHYSYNLKDMEAILLAVNQVKTGNLSVVTTRKDAVKFKDLQFSHVTNRMPLFYLPIKVEFVKGKVAFDEMVLKAVKPKNVGVY